METTAKLRGVRLSAQKGRLVADQIRGMPVDRALNVLQFSPKRAATIILMIFVAGLMAYYLVTINRATREGRE